VGLVTAASLTGEADRELRSRSAGASLLSLADLRGMFKGSERDDRRIRSELLGSVGTRKSY
jgi:hypothetical protein